MNRRLNLDIPQNNTFLLPRDVLAATNHLIGMKFGTGILEDDDMNHLKNKHIHSGADLLQDQFGLALGRLQHAVQKTIHRVFIRQSKPTPQTLVTPTSTSILLINTYETFFGTYYMKVEFIPLSFESANTRRYFVFGKVRRSRKV
uniref:RNA polymerase Rpb2 domain-containing protein n=2 Tax=Aegilops tauschii subsp. strangulata TaxID=200361 RepID=A0A453L8T4_AEGTS